MPLISRFKYRENNSFPLSACTHKDRIYSLVYFDKKKEILVCTKIIEKRWGRGLERGVRPQSLLFRNSVVYCDIPFYTH